MNLQQTERMVKDAMKLQMEDAERLKRFTVVLIEIATGKNRSDYGSTIAWRALKKEGIEV